jgi:hypothetical protein
VTKVIFTYDAFTLNIAARMTSVIENPLIDFSDYAADKEFEKQFHLMFPYLRIVLRKVVKIPQSNMIANPRLIITENTTVEQVCDKLLIRYGREVMIQRYTVNIWLDITRSKHWTLKNQNEEARKLSCMNPGF